MVAETIKGLAQELRRMDVSFARIEPGSTAELEDENDPQGMVIIRDSRGAPRLCMPREVWDDLRKWQPPPV